MRKIKEVLRLKLALGLSDRQIAQTCSISRSSVASYLQRAASAGIGWPLPDHFDDALLEARLFSSEPSNRSISLPDFAHIHRELRLHSHLTLHLLWEEYKLDNPSGYQYSRFCDLYRLWEKKLNPVMRIEHKAGDKLFVDYSGDTLPYYDPSTKELRQAQIFVAVLGASSYTYAEATASQNLSDWIGAQERALHFFGGVPRALVPDNTRTAVRHPCRYEPELNPTYQEFAIHYSTAIVPARVRKPRDKAKVECHVLVVQRWILARLRNVTLIGLDQVNQAIAGLLDALNSRPLRIISRSRRELFEELDRPALSPLPEQRFVFCQWKRARANIDYHIEIDSCFYSVPYSLIHQQVEARITSSTVEIFHKDQRVASHPRLFIRGRYSTLNEHMPSNHRKYADWSPSRLISWAEQTGEATAEMVRKMLESRHYPEQAYRACLGLLRLSERYSAERVEAACRRAGRAGATGYKSVKSILEKGLDRLEQSQVEQLPLFHENVRGPQYYQQEEKDADTTDIR